MRRRDLRPPALPPIAPPRSGRPPSDWARVTVENDELVVHLGGWRRVLGLSRGVRIPSSAIVSVRFEPSAHSAVPTKIRRNARPRTRLWRLGAYHGWDGWSYWACGLGRHAVVIETTGVRYHYVVIESREPEHVMRVVRQAAGLRGGGDPAPPAGRDRLVTPDASHGGDGQNGQNGRHAQNGRNGSVPPAGGNGTTSSGSGDEGS